MLTAREVQTSLDSITCQIHHLRQEHRMPHDKEALSTSPLSSSTSSKGSASHTQVIDLGEGLVQHWSTSEDVERLAELLGTVWRRSEDEPINARMMDSIRRDMRGASPFMGATDCALVEDTQAEGRPIVACACLWHTTWLYEGVPLRIGRPETISTLLAYRRRGLVRSLMGMLHARSAQDGHHMQAIMGIPFFYRQFGYEYALPLGGKRTALLNLLPAREQSSQPVYTLRSAQVTDIPLLMELYNQRRTRYLVWQELSEDHWRYKIGQWQQVQMEGIDPAIHGVNECVQILVDAQDAPRGFVMTATKRWGPELNVYALEFAPGSYLPNIVPDLLHALTEYGATVPHIRRSIEPLSAIGFNLGESHPVYELLGQAYAPVSEPAYAWYIRVSNLPTLLLHIAPVLERRLAQSVLAGFSGDLKLNLYGQALQLTFAEGRLRGVAPWQPPAYPVTPVADVACPPLVFLQILFGYRSLGELRASFPDLSATPLGELFLNALFPTKPSWVG